MSIRALINTRQHTLRQSISCVGIGLHRGRKIAMTLRPNQADGGIVFIRRDVHPGEGLIVARWYNIDSTNLSTTLANAAGTTLATVEHLLAALSGCGVDNALIEVDGPEIPIMDGSAFPFVRMIETLGIVEQDAPRLGIWIHRPLRVEIDDRMALLSPSVLPKISVSIDFPHSAVGTQSFSSTLTGDHFARMLAGARTFGFRADVDRLRRAGLIRGASLRNAVVVDGYRVENPEGLRCPDEFARHKALDCVGDLSLAGAPILGHLYASRPGHQLNRALLRALFDNPHTWSYIPIAEYLSAFGLDAGMSAAPRTGNRKMAAPRHHREWPGDESRDGEAPRG